MTHRRLLVGGIAAIAASFLIGGIAVTTGAAGIPMRGWFSSANGQPISIDQAQQSVQSFLDRTGDRDLKIDELMEFQQNFYALIKERSTGIGAFELLVDKSDGAVAFEPGPDMMWNTKYGMMGRGGMTGGTMGSYSPGLSSAAMPVASDQATEIAQGWLDNSLRGNLAGTPDAFYGYYTFHFMTGGQIAGMLSVNGYSGQVWFHTWHGGFIQARDFGA
jgi:urease beta subunit